MQIMIAISRMTADQTMEQIASSHCLRNSQAEKEIQTIYLVGIWI